jgi:hypothetical protein
VFKGNLVPLGPGPNDVFVHGGSEWILSRAAVGRILQNRTASFGANWECDSDDVVIMKVREILGLSLDDINTDRMLGGDLAASTINAIRRRDFGTLKTCCGLKLTKGRRPQPFRTMACWHGSAHGSFPILHGSKYFYRIPETASLYFEEGGKLSITCQTLEPAAPTDFTGSLH